MFPRLTISLRGDGDNEIDGELFRDFLIWPFDFKEWQREFPDHLQSILSTHSFFLILSTTHASTYICIYLIMFHFFLFVIR